MKKINFRYLLEILTGVALSAAFLAFMLTPIAAFGFLAWLFQLTTGHSFWIFLGFFALLGLISYFNGGSQ